MEIDPALAAQARQIALEEFPEFAEFAPELAYRALFQGGTFFVQFGKQPPAGDPDTWEFQNAFVKGYKRLVGL